MHLFEFLRKSLHLGGFIELNEVKPFKLLLGKIAVEGVRLDRGDVFRELHQSLLHILVSLWDRLQSELHVVLSQLLMCVAQQALVGPVDFNDGAFGYVERAELVVK